MRLHFNEHTPIETYRVRGRNVFVKRDDLFAAPPLPPLGKLRGLQIVLEDLVRNGARCVGCWDTRISKLTQGVAVLGALYESLRTIVSYPARDGEPLPEPIRVAAEYGAELYPVRGNFPRIAWSQAKRYVESRGGVMLPFGLECAEAVDAIAREASTVPEQCYAGGTIVLCGGSGVTATGLLRGLRSAPSRMLIVSSGRSPAQIARTMARYVAVPDYVRIVPPIMPYDQAARTPCPFPAHPNYDVKAWGYLVDRIDRRQEAVLFWNVGA
jgi:1-aminocyclopropane-1-carboxylate deaminase/D-cysteine desulfhydrase-like pyridoxal-dependent ACC family enzyme